MRVPQNFTDVLVVGSGPAGSSLALLLARQGYQVTVLERAQFPRSKPCGDYLTPGAVALLRDELGVLPQMMAQGAAPISLETVTTHAGMTFGGHTEAIACLRSVTDTTLRDAARAAGATMEHGVHVRDILWNNGAVVGVSGTDASGQPCTWNARVTAGADGTHSLLARALGVVRPLPRLQKIALVGHFADGMPSAAISMHLPIDQTDACCGVGSPCGMEGARNVSIVVPQKEAGKVAGRRDDYFRDRLRLSFPAVWEWVKEAAPVGPLQSVGCFGHTTTRAAHAGALLVGDAATFVHPLTGEGVFFALEGARLAAQAIDTALQTGDTTYAVLRAYDAARRRELLPRYRLCGLVQRVTHSPTWLAWAADRLRRSPALTDLLLQTMGDALRPADLVSWRTMRLMLAR